MIFSLLTENEGGRPVWLARDGGTPVGTASVGLPDKDGQRHLAEIEVNVHPAERRRGVGRGLLNRALGTARDHGRRRALAHAEDGSGTAFAEAGGFGRVLTLEFTRLELAGMDGAALDRAVAEPHPGYRLVSWDGMVPPEWAASFVASRSAMDDAPMGDADAPAPVWDLERMRAAVRAVAERGEHLHTVAVAAGTEIVGFTELVVPADGTGDAQHYGTAVLPGHRGRGLARWMKAESIRAARARHPELAGLLTDTAVQNAAMRAVNAAFGYRPTHTLHRYEIDL